MASQDVFDQAAYGCRYMLWRAFYEDEWRQTATAAPTSPAAAAASTPASAPAKKHK